MKGKYGGNYILNLYKELSDKRIDLLTLIILSVLVLLARIPFMSKFLYNDDSVNYALAFQNYNITLYQPHPPGYIFYVASGKIVYFFFGDPNLSLIFLSILFSILTVLIIYFLGIEMFSRKFGLTASLLLVFNPIFWLYGEIAASYMGGAFFASLIAFTSYRVLKGDNRFLYISAVVLGLAGGFRQDLILLMLPLWIYCITYTNQDIKKIIAAILIMVFSGLLWFVPTVILAGGCDVYSSTSKGLIISIFSIHSIIFGGDVIENLIMDFRVLFWSVLGLGIVNTFLLLIFILYKFKSFKMSLIRNSKFILIVLWIIPTLIFDLLFLFARPGYILVFLPSFALIMAYVIIVFSSDLQKRFTKISANIFLIIVLSISLFSGILHFAYPNENGIYSVTIQSVDQNYQNIYDSILLYGSNNTVIFFNDDVNWRKTMYYCPDQETYTIYSVSTISSYQVLIHYKNGKTEVCGSKVFEIHLDPSTTKILWLIDTNSELFRELNTKIEIKTLKLPNGRLIYYSDISNDILISNLHIIKDEKQYMVGGKNYYG